MEQWTTNKQIIKGEMTGNKFSGADALLYLGFGLNERDRAINEAIYEGRVSLESSRSRLEFAKKMMGGSGLKYEGLTQDEFLTMVMHSNLDKSARDMYNNFKERLSSYKSLVNENEDKINDWIKSGDVNQKLLMIANSGLKDEEGNPVNFVKLKKKLAENVKNYYTNMARYEVIKPYVQQFGTDVNYTSPDESGAMIGPDDMPYPSDGSISDYPLEQQGRVYAWKKLMDLIERKHVGEYIDYQSE
jgi:hypothetical protein